MITKDEMLEGSSALAVFMREYADTIDRGWARPYTAHNQKHRICYAKHETGAIMGGILYGLNHLTKTGWIVFSFTCSEFRRRGVYTALYREVTGSMTKAGMKVVASHVHVHNATMQSCSKSVGMQPEYIRMNRQLK